MLCAFWLLGRQDRTWVFRYFMLFRQKGQWSMMVNADIHWGQVESGRSTGLAAIDLPILMACSMT